MEREGGRERETVRDCTLLHVGLLVGFWRKVGSERARRERAITTRHAFLDTVCCRNSERIKEALH